MQPRVLAVCLTADRSKMTERAVASFQAQTYENKKLLIWDTGELNDDFDDELRVFHIPAPQADRTIGALRNDALGFWNEYDIAVTWDSDDWSHPNRIAEQVAHLQASKADVVGYSELLFWRLPIVYNGSNVARPAEAWIFKNVLRPPGTSLCYWRKTWERKPFPDLNVSEDTHWLTGLTVGSAPGFDGPCVQTGERLGPLGTHPIMQFEPRMIASIHGGNTSGGYDIEGMIERGSQSWRRVPEWDAFCEEKMKL